MPLWGRVGKVFSLHVREQIPVCSDTRPVFAQPLSFNLCHRVVAERILTRKASTFQNLQTLPKFPGPLAVVFALCDLTRKRHGKPQSVLPVTYFNVSDQPIPIHVSVRQCQPRQALGNSGVKVRLVQRVKQDSGRVLSFVLDLPRTLGELTQLVDAKTHFAIGVLPSSAPSTRKQPASATTQRRKRSIG